MLSSCYPSGFPVKWPEDHHWCSMCMVWFVRVLCISHRHGARSWMLVPCGWSNILWIDLCIWVTFVLLFFKPILWLKLFTLALWTFYRFNWCDVFTRQIQAALYMLLLQALAKPMADSPLSVCATGVDDNLSWTGECCTYLKWFTYCFTVQYAVKSMAVFQWRLVSSHHALQV